MLQKVQCFVLNTTMHTNMYYAKLQMLLHKTTDFTTNNYTNLQI